MLQDYKYIRRCDDDKYFWMHICPVCGLCESPYTSTLLHGLHMKQFDAGIYLYCEAYIRPTILDKLTNPQNVIKRNAFAVRMVRICLAYYWKTWVQPYLVLDDQVEIDETACKTATDYNHLCYGKMFRWVFGMLCRRTRIIIMYGMIHRRMHNIHDIIKRHVAPGTTIYSDASRLYCNLKQRTSMFDYLGMDYVHYWTNHNAGDYVDRKFPFNKTMGLESQWGRFKLENQGSYTCKHVDDLQRVCDAYSAKGLIKPEKLRDFVYRCYYLFMV